METLATQVDDPNFVICEREASDFLEANRFAYCQAPWWFHSRGRQQSHLWPLQARLEPFLSHRFVKSVGQRKGWYVKLLIQKAAKMPAWGMALPELINGSASSTSHSFLTAKCYHWGRLIDGPFFLAIVYVSKEETLWSWPLHSPIPFLLREIDYLELNFVCSPC